MLFYVNRLREKGLLIPRHNVVRMQGAMGILRLKEERDTETLRSLRVARLTEWPVGLDVLPPLMDATLIHAGDTWSMTGWERGEAESGLYKAAYQQSWWMTPLKLSEQIELARERQASLKPP